MDSFIVGSLMQSVHQNQVLQYQASCQANQELEKERVLALKRKLVNDVKQVFPQLKQDAKSIPQKAYIGFEFLSFNLRYYDLKPEDFEEIGEREEVVLLARRLAHLHEEILENLPKELVESCNRYLEAVSYENEVNLLIQKARAYRQWEESDEKLTQKKKLKSRIDRLQGVLSVMLLVLLGASLALFINQAGLISNLLGTEIAIVFLVAIFVIWVILEIVILLLLGRRQPKDISTLTVECQQLAERAWAQNGDYWDQAAQKFGSPIDITSLKNIRQKARETKDRILEEELKFRWEPNVDE